MMTDRKPSYSTINRNNKNRLKCKMVIQNKVRSPKNTSEPSTSSATRSLVTVTEPESQSDSSDSEWSLLISHKRKLKVGGGDLH